MLFEILEGPFVSIFKEYSWKSQISFTIYNPIPVPSILPTTFSLLTPFSVKNSISFAVGFGPIFWMEIPFNREPSS